jgi:predicted membrane-bound spermidine synthase
MLFIHEALFYNYAVVILIINTVHPHSLFILVSYLPLSHMFRSSLTIFRWYMKAFNELFVISNMVKMYKTNNYCGNNIFKSKNNYRVSTIKCIKQ